MGDFTHFDLQGNAVMADVSGKSDTDREAVACGRILMSQECFHLVKGGGMKKGDVLGVAEEDPRADPVMSDYRTYRSGDRVRATAGDLCHRGSVYSPDRGQDRG